MSTDTKKARIAAFHECAYYCEQSVGKLPEFGSTVEKSAAANALIVAAAEFRGRAGREEFALWTSREVQP